MNLTGRATLVCFVLSAMPIHLLIVVKAPKWFIKAIDKIRRGFLWKGRRQVNGGSCLAAWEQVQRPIDLGGLGILNLEIMAWALQIRWLWLRKTQVDKPWGHLDVPTYPNSLALFAISITSQPGNGSNILFWTDRWLHGCSIEELAPLVVSHVQPRIRRQGTVQEALENQTWPHDIQGSLSMEGLYEYFQLWDIMEEVFLTENEDQHTWKWDSEKRGRADPIMAGDVKKDHLGVGAVKPGEVSAEDDIYEQYKKRMMLGYRYRPNPLNNPRKQYY
ncbi:hypothetical protein PR202_gb16888 [Eleusine coracana subsp. coracana]|uniref:Uncharacterized protein n=1 Tax=Eleusine coracana subsp. coracana TaxID=191504 RepID=A0AAV5F1B0_ELECO|nr:hypothetical protein PR202_gb16888 [Eleusine coracana subsp. coracana]